MTRNKLTRLRSNLTGERGLLLAIIVLAYRDMLYGTPEQSQGAQHYFAGATYREHLELLGLEPELMPQVGAGQIATA